MSAWLGGARGIPAGWHQLAEELDRELLAIAGRTQESGRIYTLCEPCAAPRSDRNIK